ncbi:MAG: CsbD family protein [Microbacterium sp.]|nr:MAG: CsbD family protein [Microbacterium sp.]PZU36538.1 MAG: CsbD family protein [Microbacterium sp.]
MGFADDVKNTAENLAGKAKEAIGNLTDNDKLVAEGKADQVKAHAKDAASDVKDAAKDAKDALGGK